MTSKELRFGCIFCTFVGNASSKLRTHFKLEHPRQNYFWCNLCGKFTDYLDEFFEHLDQDLCSEVYQHPCGFDGCDFTSQEPSRFIVHNKSFHRGKPLIPCKYCKRLFTLPSCLVLHLQSECWRRPNAKEDSISKYKDKPLGLDLKEGIKEHFLHNQSTSRNKANEEHHSSKSTHPTEELSVTDSKPANRKKGVEKIPMKEEHVELFNTYSGTDVDHPTRNPCEIEDDVRGEPRRVGRPRKNASCKKARVEKGNKNSESKKAEKPYKRQSHSNKEMELKKWREWLEKMREFKSQQALDDLLHPEKTTNFFKCMHSTCSFSSQSKMDFILHILSSEHEILHRCCYCFLTFDYIENFTDHMLQNHSDRRYQYTYRLPLS